MLFKEFVTKITELQKNKITKGYADTTVYPDSIEYNKYYKPFKGSFKIDSIEIRYRTDGIDMYVVPWMVVNKQPISMGMLHLRQYRSYAKYGYNLFEIENAYLKTDIQGKGIMPQIYTGLVERGYNLVASGTQSPGAIKMWRGFYGKEGMNLWAVFGLRFFVKPEIGRTKKDYIESLYITDKFGTLPDNPELKAIILTQDGVEEIKDVYVDSEGYEEMESILILTAEGSDLDDQIRSMQEFEEFPEEKKLYNALSSILLKK